MERHNEPITPAPGHSEVHSEMSVNPSKGAGMSGRFDSDGAPAGAVNRTRAKASNAREEITERATEMKDRVAEARSNVSARAGELKSRAREGVGRVRADAERVTDELQGRANRVLEDSGATRKVEQYPLAALGVAFGAGFLLAGSGTQGSGRVSKAKHQIRGALMTAATAALAREARSMLGLHSGNGAGLADLLGGGGTEARRSRTASTYTNAPA